VAIIYVVANIALAWHVFHGAWSMFQSLGVVAVHQRNEIGFTSGLRAARFG
jgi:succinate dehydrogenase / fumarate reductase cytochrome b subunit